MPPLGPLRRHAFGAALLLPAVVMTGTAPAEAPERAPLPPAPPGLSQESAPAPDPRPGAAVSPAVPTDPPDVVAIPDAPIPKPRPGVSASALIGIFSLGTGRTALLLLPGGEVRQVAVGDTIDGWRVSSISQKALRMTRGGETRTFPLMGN